MAGRKAFMRASTVGMRCDGSSGMDESGRWGRTFRGRVDGAWQAFAYDVEQGIGGTGRHRARR